MGGDRARIGLLWPADGRNDKEFWQWLPGDVALLVARYDVGGTLDLEQLERDAAPDGILAAANLLRHAAPDVITLGDCAGSFVGGKSADLEQSRAIEEATGVRTISMSTSLVAAVSALKADRVAVLSPYAPQVTERFLNYLSEHGVASDHDLSMSQGREAEIHAMSADDWIREARRADCSTAKALVVIGGGVSLSSIVGRLETELRKPVITGPGALMWAALSHLHVHHRLGDRGALYGAESESGMAEDPPASDLRETLSSATKTYAVTDNPPTFVSAHGAWLTDAEGKRYLDFACGSGSTNLGHNHPAIMAAVNAQLASGITHVGPHFHAGVQTRLYKLLRSVLPSGLHRFHPATNGTEAVEAALKAAMHHTGNGAFLAFEGSYHGRTLGALAVSAAKGQNEALGSLTPETVFLPYGCGIEELEQAIGNSPPLAGIIVEPVQATNGMVIPPSGFLKTLAGLAASRQIPLIFDEVFTGFGRTGRLFAFEHDGVTPDLLVLAKAFGGGFPGGLVAGREDIMTSWKPGTQSSTFQLHPVTAVAAMASLEGVLGDDVLTNVEQIEQWMRQSGADLSDDPSVACFRGLGAMFGVEIVDRDGKPDQVRTKAIRATALKAGLITWECGSHGHVIGLVPPLNAGKEEIAEGFKILHRAFAASRKQ